MNNNLCFVMAQVNPLVGDVYRNTQMILATAKKAKKDFNANLVIFPELTITGYPPEDLLLRPDLHYHVNNALKEIEHANLDVDILFGYPELSEKGIYNAAAYVANGKIIAKYYKQCLPNYGVFDEKRYFIPGTSPCIVNIHGLNTAIIICEDGWENWPSKQAKQAGAELIISINASPFDLKKSEQREKVIKSRVEENVLPIIYVANYGGQDELVFDGGSFAMSRQGEIMVHAGYYKEALMPVYIKDKMIQKGEITPPPGEMQNIYDALVLGIKDYVRKNGFKGTVLGLSGGIDSALVLCLAVDALGAENVEAVLLPSRYTSPISIEDAQMLARNLQVKHSTISIEPAFEAFTASLEDALKGYPADTTEENLQARCRGVILMAISNKKGYLLLTTGNKSEMAVGYATLYGDMAGGFAAIKDVPKTMVYRLCAYRNDLNNVIPERIITRAPSAELAHNQTDQDTLPDYAILDAILEKYVENDYSMKEIIAMGYDPAIVAKVLGLVDRNEYKRRQSAPGIRVTKRAFGRERRYPMTSGFRYNLTAKD
jgi:NAD+ synthase (glutamine-hydrolysing)